MDCKQVKNMFSEYLDGSLAADQREQLEDHLEKCAECRLECDSLLDSWEMLTDYEVPQVGDQFTRQVIEKVHAKSVEFSETGFLTRLLAVFSLRNFSSVPALASLVVLIGIGYFLLSGRPTGLVDKTDFSNGQKIEIVRDLNDEEIIRNLEIYENAEILENLDLLVDMEAVESLEADE
ncbi:MAG: zf-HC2 domain-containing protein [Candidatus Riflebacteria bacterium]|nr:zf-HC2 domain-containing protein [Candidatus Riflebacteria bacterium]